MKSGRVVIVGGGVVGLCSAYYALKRGFPVTVIEREGNGTCSVGNAGMIVPSHFIPLAAPGMVTKGLRMMLNPESPFFVKPRLDPALMRWAWLFARSSTEKHVAASGALLRDLSLESRRLFTELSVEENFGLQQRGLLMLCKTAEGLDGEADVASAAKRLGLQAEVMDAGATSKLDPSITMHIKGAVYFPQDCHLEPLRFVSSMRRRVRELGGIIESDVAIDRIETRNARVTAVAGSGRCFEGGKFVIAAGVWSAGLLAQVGVKLPLQAGKGYALTLPSPPELPQLCSIFAEAKVAATPMHGCLRFAGTMEVAGLDLSVNTRRLGGIIQSVPDYFPNFSTDDFSGIEPWAGLRPVSADGLPYLGQTARFSNLFTACGHAMMGLSLAPVSGRLIADLLSNDVPFRPIEALAPGRF